MKPTIHIDATVTPDGSKMELYRHDNDWYIQVGHLILMGSRAHDSEDRLGVLACMSFQPTDQPRVLIGGLGMGFTLRTALNTLPAGATVTVAELLPDVVRWNQEHFGAMTRHPLRDPRVTVVEKDVHDCIKKTTEPWDVIILDVDNGPNAFTDKNNARLYSLRGTRRLAEAMAPKGRLAIWSTEHDPRYVKRLESSGFRVETHELRAHRGKGTRHVVWVGIRHKKLPYPVDHTASTPKGSK